MDPYNNYNSYQYIQNCYNQPMIHQQSVHIAQNSNIVQTNRSIYINQNFQGMKTLPAVSNKVLINPNFVAACKVHINPNYIKPRGVYVNPKVLHVQTDIIQSTVQRDARKVVPNLTENDFKASDIVVSTKNKWVRKSTKPIKKETTTLGNIIQPGKNIQSTYKLLKTPLKYSKYKIIRKETTPKRKRRTSLNLPYKIVRSNLVKLKTPEQKVSVNKFKVDHRLSMNSIKSKLYLVNKAYRMKIDHRNAILKRNSISSPYKLVKTPLSSRKPSVKMSTSTVKLAKTNNRVLNDKLEKNMSRILNISGRKYKMDNNKMVLKLAMTGDVNTSKRAVKVRRSDVKIPLRKTLKTNNIPCPTYHRFGICQRHNRGMCQKKHNPDQITLCSKFLQGVCHNDKCTLSHKISASKMATCTFYLEGLCTKDGCPYLHVKVNAKVAICRDFLSGFCHLGKECDKRHEFLCPDFEQNGRCAKLSCQFPHGKIKRQSFKVKVRSVKSVKYNVRNDESVKPVKVTALVSSSKRYYDGEDAKAAKLTGDSKVDIEKLVEMTDVINSSTNEVETKYLTGKVGKMPELGNLPTFIPF